jgi:hypothetical protein
METLISMASTPDTIVKFKLKTITDTFLLTKFDTIVIQKGIFGRSKVIQNTSIIDYEFEDTFGLAKDIDGSGNLLYFIQEKHSNFIS